MLSSANYPFSTICHPVPIWDNLSGMNGTVTAEKRAVGARLERLREVFGFKTKTDFAEWMGIKQDTYRHYVEGRNRFPDALCLILKERKGVTADWLRYGDTSGLPRELFQQIFRPEAMG